MVADQVMFKVRQFGQFIRRWPPAVGIGRSLGVITMFLALWFGYVLTGQPITLLINDQSYPVRTHHLTVEGLLAELGLSPTPQDIIDPPILARLKPGQVVKIELARPVLVEVDGRALQLMTHQQNVAGVLAEAGVLTNTKDEILIDANVGNGQSLLPTISKRPGATQDLDAASFLLVNHTLRRAFASARPKMVHLTVRRAIPITLYDGGLSSTFFTTQPTIGEALLAQNLTLYLGDKVTPTPGTRLSPGMRIYIQRSIPVAISADGRAIKTRTRGQTVAELLAQEGIALMGQDFSYPPIDQTISANETIEVVRVQELLEIAEEFIPFETNWIPADNMPLDQQELRQQGNIGIIKTRSRIRYENGREVVREVEDEWLDQEPSDRLIAYGTQITVRTLPTENGPIEYWRKISMLATHYSAATAGKDPNHPRYGITRSGLPAGYGKVAIDPNVIPLMTELYIPGYGKALAADTGGLVRGKQVDLGYDEDQPLPNRSGWRDVYLLTPVPPPHEIRYVLPNWPQR